MAVKQVVVSDISGTEVSDEQHARIVINEHPALPGSPVELDVSSDEAGQLQESKIDLVNLTVYEPNRAPRRVVLDAAGFNKAFKGVDMDAILANARKVESSDSGASRGGTRRTRGTGSAGTASKAARVDYTQPDTFGQIHRGRITEEEAALVRENREQASKNREAQGHPPINWDDPKEVKRYGL